MNRMMHIIAAGIALSVATSALAVTHSLQSYAYVESKGVNRVDTGYLAGPLSRYFIDFQQTQSNVDAQGIFGGTSQKPKCAFYTTNGNGKRRYRWYYRDSGNVAPYITNIDTARRVFTVLHPTSNSETFTLDVYKRTSPITMQRTQPHTAKATTSTLSIFALDASSYTAGTKRIFCFEAADDTASVQPTVFLAPTKDANGKAGFTNIVDGTFHGEAQSSPSSAMTFADGVGSAKDYKYEDSALYAKFRAYSADSDLGTVKFGDGAASDSVETWVKRGDTVQLTAEGIGDYMFKAWSGDTWAISSDSTSSSTITLTNGTTAIQLLASYKRKPWHWTGGANEENPQWFTLANWDDGNGNAPLTLMSGDEFVFDQADPVSVAYNPTDAAFAITSITFADGAGAVTVTGDAMSSVSSMVCANGVENVMSNAVTFASAIAVTATSGYVRFAGGATGTGISGHADFYGVYTVTATGDWTPPDGSTLQSSSVLNLPDGTYYDHINRMSIESGAAVNVKQTKTDSTGSKYLFNSNKGVVTAENEIYSGTELYNGNGGSYFEQSYGGGVFISKRLRMTGVLIIPLMPTKTIIGQNGIQHGVNGFLRIGNWGSHYIGSMADWQIYYNDHSNSSTDLKGMRKIGGEAMSTLIFDTTDYYDDTVGRTITAESGIGGSSAAYAELLGVVVEGIGKFVFANTGTNDCDFAGGLTVSNSATVAVKSGARPGRGTVTLADTSTLEVSESSNIVLGGNLVLGVDATLAFNFTSTETAPVLTIPSGSTIPDTVNVKVSASERLTKWNLALTSGYDFSGKKLNVVDKPAWAGAVSVDADGNIAIQPPGMIFTLR